MNQLYRIFVESSNRDAGRRILSGRPGGPWIRFDELRRRAESLGRRLDRARVRRGSVVLLRIGNHPSFVIATLAIWSLGGVVAAVPEEILEEELKRIHRTFRPVCEVTAPDGRLRVAPIAADGMTIPGAASIRLTSGSTGSPRGAVMTAAKLVEGGRAIIRKLVLRRDDLNLGVVPLNHAYGFDHLVLPLILQGMPVLLFRRPLPALILRALRSERAMQLAAVPYILDLLARHPNPAPRQSGLWRCVSAGAPLPGTTAEAFRLRFGVPVRTFYGASECGGITFDGSPDGDAAEGCVGTPLPGVRLTLDRTGLSHLPAGQGRVVVSGPAVSPGYVPDPSAELEDGSFRTSDIGRFDLDGRLHLVGRVSSLVNVSGKKVNPSEVEGALLALDGVLDAVALGIADDRRGERLEAWVVTRDGRAAAAIRSALATKLSGHKVPREIHIVQVIPRTPRGKLDRPRLLRGG